jgi:hypothetical protein
MHNPGRVPTKSISIVPRPIRPLKSAHRRVKIEYSPLGRGDPTMPGRCLSKSRSPHPRSRYSLVPTLQRSLVPMLRRGNALIPTLRRPKADQFPQPRATPWGRDATTPTSRPNGPTVPQSLVPTLRRGNALIPTLRRPTAGRFPQPRATPWGRDASTPTSRPNGPTVPQSISIREGAPHAS